MAIDWMDADPVPGDILLKKANGASDAELGGTIFTGPGGQQTFVKFGQPPGQSYGQRRVDPKIVHGCPGKNFGMNH